MNIINSLIHYTKKAHFWFVHGRRMKSFGKGSTIIDYLKIQGENYITVEDGVYIHKHVWLGVYPITDRIPALEIGAGTTIGNYNHICCVGKMTFGKKVLTADKVYISDHLHNYENPNMPISEQGISFKGEVVIGDGAWIGENVCIIAASIGRNSVVGANSVVTKDVPEYSVVAGNPAKIIKQFNHVSKIWERVT